MGSKKIPAVIKKPSESQAESKIEKAVSKHAVETGWISRKFASPQRRGVPDRIFMKNGVVLFVEFKAPGKKPTKQQQAEIDRYKDASLNVCVVDDTEAGKKILDDFAERMFVEIRTAQLLD